VTHKFPRTALLALGLACSLSGCSADSLATSSFRNRIHPGQGLDTVTLGESKEQVEKALGAPEGTDQNDFNKSQTYDLYYSKGLELGFARGELESIVCHPQKDRWVAYPGATAEGLWVGSRKSDFEKVLGTPKAAFPEALKYPTGLWGEFDKDGKVLDLRVLKPGKA
jgi:hypothetical protein